MKQILQIMLLLFCITMHAQDYGGKKQLTSSTKVELSMKETKSIDGSFQSLDPFVINQISSMKLEKNKVLHLAQDNTSNYFLVNTSSLTSEFEKIYFYKSIVKNNLSIQVDHGLPADTAWVISDLKKSSSVDSTAIALLLNETKKVSSKMSTQEKTVWLSNN